MVGEYKRILVAIDGSEEANLALEKAVSIAKRNNAQLFIAHVVEIPRVRDHKHSRDFKEIYREINEQIGTSIKENGQAILDESVQYAEKQGAKEVIPILEVGSAKQIVSTKIPDAENIELIILGATGIGGFARFLIGSVTQNVTRYAKCDVLVVRKITNE